MKIYLVNIFLHHFRHMPKYYYKEEIKMAEQKNIQNNKSVPKLVKLEIPETVQFNDIIRVLTVPSVKIEKKITELFSSMFADYEGCKIVQNSYNDPLKCIIYFRPCMNKGDGLYAVKLLGENNSNNKNNGRFSTMISAINMANSQKRFDLEDIAKEILAGFIYCQDTKLVERYDEELGKIVKVRLPKNWSPFIQEVDDKVVNTGVYINQYLAVTLDLTLVIGKLLGRKNPKEVNALKERGIIPKNRYQYNVSIAKTLSIGTKSYILEIKRIDIEALNELSQSIGETPIQGTIVMTRN